MLGRLTDAAETGLGYVSGLQGCVRQTPGVRPSLGRSDPELPRVHVAKTEDQISGGLKKGAPFLLTGCILKQAKILHENALFFA